MTRDAVTAQIVPYQHVVVVMSILLGLTVTQLIKGVAQLHRARSKVRPYWLHSAWCGFLVLFSFFLWWTYWNYRAVEAWDFLRFVAYLLPMLIFYFLAAIIIPDPSEAVTDLREYYFANRRAFFGTFAIYGVVAGTAAVLVRGLPLLDPSQLGRAALVLLMLIAVRSERERTHAGILILGVVLLGAFILLVQPTIG